MSPKIVFFKTVVSGPSPRKDEILEASFAALDCSTGRVVEELTVELGSELDSLETAQIGNVLLADYAQDNPLDERDALPLVSGFLNRHSTVEKIGRKTGQKFRVARLAGHGVAKLDFPMLRAWYEAAKEFMPADPYAMDLVQMESWLDTKRAATIPYEDLLLTFDFYGPLSGIPKSKILSPSLRYVRRSVAAAADYWISNLAAGAIP